MGRGLLLHRHAVVGLGLLALSVKVACASALPQDLSHLSLEDLGNVVVSSVAKTPEPLGEAAAAVYVISHDDILRSGASTLPDILRLAPNLEIFQTSPSGYIISARGVSGNLDALNFSNKLLVLIDGRSVYSPIFSGMYWEDQYVPPESIERIEVISGPGGALWGANAVSGVINIITRDSAQTQGGLIDLRAGNLESGALVQYGGAMGKHSHYRAYVRDIRRQSFDNIQGQSAHDSWHNPQVGFRMDWDAGGADALMLQGDVHDGRISGATLDQRHTEADVVARWRHTVSDDSSFQLQAFYDRVLRYTANGDGFALSTWDLEFQQNVALGEHHQLVWGVGDRVYRYAIAARSVGTYLWDPSENTQNLANAFVQDQIALTRNTQLTLGLKAENDPYSALSLMPNVRLSWKPGGGMLLWAAGSRAVRSPTPFEEDIVGANRSFVFLLGNPDFRREKVTAYDAGWRAQVATRATASVSVFYNVYDDLRTLEFPPPTLVPAHWGNEIAGHAHGVEAWGSYAVSDAWKLSAGFTMLRQQLHIKPGSTTLLAPSQAGNDPSRQGFIRSTMNFSDRWTLYLNLRGVSPLPDPRTPGYVELDARLAWRMSDRLELSLSGTSLLRPWHQEYTFLGTDRVGRSVLFDARLKF